MASGKRYYWMKLKESFMTSDTIDYFMSQKDGANYVVLYQMLCLKTINTDGRLSRQIGEIIIPYDIEKIQRDCKWFSIDTIRIALKLYQSVGLIYEDADGVLVLAGHDDLVGSETDFALQKRNQREIAQPVLPPVDNGVDKVVDNAVDNVHTDIRDRDKSLDIRDKSIDINIYTSLSATEAEKPPSVPFEKIKTLYNSVCISFPQIKSIDGERRKAVGARWNKYKSLDVFEELFHLCEQSDFLKGQNERNWKADFDWMMKANNFAKILEHKYDNKKGAAGLTGVFATLQRLHEEAENDEAGSD